MSLAATLLPILQSCREKGEKGKKDLTLHKPQIFVVCLSPLFTGLFVKDLGTKQVVGINFCILAHFYVLLYSSAF